jgi:nucleoside-diphosphate-sugar epimerase
MVHFLEKKNIECYTPNMRQKNIFDHNLGNVIYTIGVSDFLNYPYAAVDAHVCLLKNLLENTKFDSLVYLSSGRFYYKSTSTNESDPINTNPNSSNELYNISKLLGESLCISSKHENIKIVRPSNVVGIGSPSNLFIPSIINDAISKNKITLNSTLDSEKDYVYVDDVVEMLYEISLHGKSEIYNIGMGKNTTSKEIVDKISLKTGCDVEISTDATRFFSPPISVEKITSQFNFKPSPITDKLNEIITHYQQIK